MKEAKRCFITCVDQWKIIFYIKIIFSQFLISDSLNIFQKITSSTYLSIKSDKLWLYIYYFYSLEGLRTLINQIKNRYFNAYLKYVRKIYQSQGSIIQKYPEDIIKIASSFNRCLYEYICLFIAISVVLSIFLFTAQLIHQKLYWSCEMAKSTSKLANNEIQSEVAWIRQPTNYEKITNDDLQQQNKKILQTLKIVQKMLDKQLESKKKNINLQDINEPKTNKKQVVAQNMKNNEGYLKVLEKQIKKLRDRRQQLKNGLQSKLNVKKYQAEKKLADLKNQLKKMKLEQKEINKKLATHENASEPQSLNENVRIEEQLRVYSLKYMKLNQKYNKITEQLALATSTIDPQFHIPEQFYDRDLQEKEQAQYKQYQGIVKLCTILSKRNDSENNKYNRVYTQKLKQLEKTIINLGQIDRMIALKEGEIIEGKKNIQLVKYKVNNNERIQNQFFTLSQSSLKRKSYSMAQLPISSDIRKNGEKQLNASLMRKLSKRS